MDAINRGRDPTFISSLVNDLNNHGVSRMKSDNGLTIRSDQSSIHSTASTPTSTKVATIPEHASVSSIPSSPAQLQQMLLNENGEYIMSDSTYDTSSSTTINSPRGSDTRPYTTEPSVYLPPLQTVGQAEVSDSMQPYQTEEEYDAGSFDLLAPAPNATQQFSLEAQSEKLFSTEHLRVIFDDSDQLLKFTSFLNHQRPASLPLLIYYLDTIKALKAIRYANAIASSLDKIPGFDFSDESAAPTVNAALEEKANLAFEALVRDDLPAYITHTWTSTVSTSIARRISGTLPIHLRETSEGLAEVFCLTDPSRPDNPIVFASEEFHRTTQYGMNYVIGRNCRFLQGPKTNPNSVRRIRERVLAGEESCEVFLNYRRDGSPFMNLLMTAPLSDSRGKIRYFIGAQVDVSGLLKECSDLESLKRILDREKAAKKDIAQQSLTKAERQDELRDLSEMLNIHELDTVRRHGGKLHKAAPQEASNPGIRAKENWAQNRAQNRILIQGGEVDETASPNDSISRFSGRLTGVYEHYLLVRPYPSLRILFASPSMRVPGILQSPFLARIGGSPRVRDELTQALADGRGVTAKVRWVTKTDVEGRNRWIHCTPLLGVNSAVGVWMIVVVDDDMDTLGRKIRQAPAVEKRDVRRSRPISGGSTEQRPRSVDSNGKEKLSLNEFATMNSMERLRINESRQSGRTGETRRSVESAESGTRTGSPNYSLR